MMPRYIPRTDDDGSFSIVDAATGRNARYAGRELRRIPARMLQLGLELMNEIDTAERALLGTSAPGPLPH